MKSKMITILTALLISFLVILVVIDVNTNSKRIIETPGVLYYPSNNSKVPDNFLDWNFHPDWMLVGKCADTPQLCTHLLIYKYFWRTGELEQIRLPGNDIIHTMIQGPGNLVAYTVGDNTIVIYDLQKENRIEIGNGKLPAFSPDGRYFVFIDGISRLNIVDLDTLEYKRVWLPPSRWRSCAASIQWSPDRARIAWSLCENEQKSQNEGFPHQFMVYDADTGEFHLHDFPVEWRIIELIWTSDDETLAFLIWPYDGDSIIVLYNIRRECIIEQVSSPDTFNIRWVPSNPSEMMVIIKANQLLFLNIEKIVSYPLNDMECLTP